MSGLTKKLLDWKEDKFDEIDVINDKHPYRQASISEGIRMRSYRRMHRCGGSYVYSSSYSSLLLEA